MHDSLHRIYQVSPFSLVFGLQTHHVPLLVSSLNSLQDCLLIFIFLLFTQIGKFNFTAYQQ